jgi:Thrombospondin type 3 repeat
MKVGVLATTMFALLIGFPIASFAGLAPDTDGDGIPDVLDKCTLDSRNATAPSTCDSDTDGYGNVCDPDFDQNFAVNSVDYTMFFVPAFKGLDPAPWPQGMDMDCNNAVNSVDYTMFFVPKFKGGLGGSKPGPSGLACAGTPGCI